jgi:hypothetical protein
LSLTSSQSATCSIVTTRSSISFFIGNSIHSQTIGYILINSLWMGLVLKTIPTFYATHQHSYFSINIYTINNLPVILVPSMRSFILFNKRRYVDLPHPDGPINAVTVFSFIDNEMSRKAWFLRNKIYVVWLYFLHVIPLFYSLIQLF